MRERGARVLPFDNGDTDAPQEVAATARDGRQPELPEVMVQELGRIIGEMLIAEYRGKPGGNTGDG